MNKKTFVFLTRVTRIDNIQKIKDQLKKVFSNATDVDYQHILLPDLTVGNTKEDFEQFKDQKTKLYYVEQKKEDDKYAAYNLDECVQSIPKERDCWIYILDDDNTITDDFAELAQYCNNQPVIVFNIKMPRISNGFDGTVNAPLKYKQALFHIDSANYLVHRCVFEKCKHGNPIKTGWHDGIFMQQILFLKLPIKYVNKVYGFHNGL